MLVSQLTLPSVYNDLPGFRGMRYENISKDFVCMLAHCPLSFIGPFLFQISRSSCRALEFPGDSRQLCLKKFCSMGNPSDSIGHCDIFSDVRQNRTDQNGKVDLLFAIGTWGVAAVPIIVQSVILFMVGELVFKWGFLISIFFGVLMVLTGIFIPRLEDKISAAYATSWAASDPVNKKATLQCASIVWTICGILICLSVFLLVHPIVVGRIDILVFSCILFIPRFYSLYYFKKYGKKNK